jgi:hypothetical protein
MSRHPQLYSWTREISTHLPCLNPALATVLALWSLGMILARCCGLDSVTAHAAALLGQSFNTVRQRLREFYQEADAKRGHHRKAVEVELCFAPLLHWILSFWTEKRLALALDVTNLGTRFHVLCISVLHGGIGIPVAWKILVGNQPDAWHPHWCKLLQTLKAATTPDWNIVVLSDRGLESARLFQAICDLGWHPLMRVKRGGKFHPANWHDWYAMNAFVPQPGRRFAMTGTAYRGERLACTLLGCWDEGHAEPWLVLTDLPPAASDPCWYAWRAWIEQGFKVAKSAGLNWQHTRMTNPDRAERQFLAIAVTTLWLVAVGGEVERQAAIETIGPLPRVRPDRVAKGEHVRRLRLFVLGATTVLAAMINQEPVPVGRITPESWPQAKPAPIFNETEFFAMTGKDLQL